VGEEVTERDGNSAARSCADMMCGRNEADEWAEEGVPSWLLERKPPVGEWAGELKEELAEAHDTLSRERNDCPPDGSEEDKREL